MAELKPCPFCGSKVFLEEERIGLRGPYYTYQCYECGMFVEQQNLISKEEAIEAYNKRADSAPISAAAPVNVREKVILRDALNTFGHERQVRKLFEEIGELQEAICKALDERDDTSHVAEEIADVQIMLGQMMEMFGCEDAVALRRHAKLARLEGRIKNRRAADGYMDASDPR